MVDSQFIKGSPLPERLGEVVDLYSHVRAVRLAMSKQVEAVHDRERELYEVMVQSFARGDRGAAGLTYRAHREPDKKEPKPEDWQVIFAHIQKTGRFELVQKRLAVEAVREVWDGGEEIPGVGHILVPVLSVTKIPKR